MSQRRSKDGLFVDTRLLRDHVDKLREKKKTATRLYENVIGMKRADDPAMSYRYEPVLRDINQLIEYFDRMALLLSNVSDDAIELSHKIGAIIEEGTEYTRHTVSNNFL